MAPSRVSNGDSDASSGGDVVMNDVSGPVARVKHNNGDFLMRVCSLPSKSPACSTKFIRELRGRVQSPLRAVTNMRHLQDALDTPDYTVLFVFHPSPPLV